MMSIRCLLPFLAASLFGQVAIQQSTDKITVAIGGKPFTTLWIGADVRKPYLYPVFSASGKNVTRNWPMEKVAGETNDHPHHRGIWFNHGDVNKVDFWSSDPLARNDNGSKIAVKKIRTAKGGKQGVIAGDFEWTDKGGTVMLHEARTMTFSASGDKRIVDFDIKLTAAIPVTFGDTKEGSFGIRLADPLKEQKASGKMTNAEGKVGEKAVWGKPSPWVDYAGTLEGEQLGITIMDHPSNPGHPTHWHSRAYGLFAANIFGLHDFYNDKSKDGSVSLKAGGTMRFRYRVMIHPGDTASTNVADEYKKFAAMK
ncbi:MAG: PmoA family protein [Bryobacteraceae bacterium]